MKIHAFRVYENGGANLATVLRHINGLDIESRWRTVLKTKLRLEIAREHASAWSLDFSVMRYDGPGKISTRQPIADFGLNGDEGFGEETAVYLHKDSMFAAVQYNHYGPKARLIQGYLTQFAQAQARQHGGNAEEHTFVFAPVLRGNAEERFRRKTVVRRLEFAVHVPETAGNPTRQTLTQYVNAPITAGARNVHMEISAGREEGAALDLGTVRNFVQDMLGLGGDVRKLSVTAKDGEDEPSEPVDFVAERLERVYAVDADPVSRRYPRNDRWHSVARAYDEWAQSGELR